MFEKSQGIGEGIASWRLSRNGGFLGQNGSFSGPLLLGIQGGPAAFGCVQ